MKRPNKKIFSRKQFVILIVFISVGFIIGYSYDLTKEKRIAGKVDSQQLVREDVYREELINQQERNKELSEEVDQLQQSIRANEKLLIEGQEHAEQYVKRAEDLRLYLGDIPSKGKGVRVLLEDAAYDPKHANPNDYIVHESHVFSVINELKIAGAEAIAVNGKRLNANSYIRCTGPVIVVDGQQFPAPFIVEAVGEQKTLSASLNLRGGIIDQLLHDNIVVTIEENDNIAMPSTNVEN